MLRQCRLRCPPGYRERPGCAGLLRPGAARSVRWSRGARLSHPPFGPWRRTGAPGWPGGPGCPHGQARGPAQIPRRSARIAATRVSIRMAIPVSPAARYAAASSSLTRSRPPGKRRPAERPRPGRPGDRASAWCRSGRPAPASTRRPAPRGVRRRGSGRPAAAAGGIPSAHSTSPAEACRLAAFARRLAAVHGSDSSAGHASSSALAAARAAGSWTFAGITSRNQLSRALQRTRATQ